MDSQPPGASGRTSPSSPDPGDEIADLVDAHDQVVGQATRREIRRRKLLHRGVAVLCRNPDGEVYVHRRTGTKDLFPGAYDMFVAGMVNAGETYAAAARRELAEELGVTGVVPRFVLKHRHDGPENPAWSAVFEVEWGGAVVPQASEIVWGAFLPERELLERLEVWPFTPDAVRRFRGYLSRRG